MTIFSATNETVAVVAADRAAIWAVLTDPKVLPRLTPLLRSIDADGETWTWHLIGISALGLTIEPSFTERMRFADGRRIDYSHQPPPGVSERTGAEGWYELSDVAGGTRLAIRLTLHADLPLPRSAGPAVRRVMATMMRRTGDRFSANLLAHLGVVGP